MFLGFADFGALEVADFQGNFFERSGNQRQHAEILRVAIALNHLGRDGSHLQAELPADFLFDFGPEVRSIADGAGDFSKFHVMGGFAETGDVALIFSEPVGDLQAEGDGLRMNAVSAADLGSVLELVGAQVENFAENDEVALDEVRSVADEERLSGVYHIIGSHAVVEPAGGIGVADGFADGHGEGDNVVLHAGFDFVDAVGVHLGARVENCGGILGHEASFGKGVGGGQFNVKPLLVAIGVAPDEAHLFAGVAWNQVGISRANPL